MTTNMKIPKVLYFVPIILILLSVILYVLPISATPVGNLYEKFETSTTNYYVTGALNNSYGQQFTPTTTHTIYGVQLYCYRSTATGTTTVSIWGLDGSGWPSGTALAAVTVDTSTLPDGEGAAAWTDFNFSTHPVLYKNTMYAIVMTSTNDYSCWGYVTGGGYSTGQDIVKNPNWGNGTGVDINFREYGYVEAELYSLTLSAGTSSIETGSYRTFEGILINLGQLKNCWGHFDYGMTNSYGLSTTPIYMDTAGQTGIMSVRVDIQPGIPNSGTLHYQFHTTEHEDLTGANCNGPDYTINLADSGLIVTQNIKNKTYDTATVGALLLNLGTNTTGTVYIKWGLTSSLTETPISLGTSVTSPNLFEAQMSSLANNTRYFYQAYYDGDVADLYGQIQYFNTSDSAKVTLVKKGNDWLDKIGLGTGGWWIAMLVLMVIPWVFLHDTKIKQIAALGIDLVIIGAFVALSIVNVWVIALLALGAGITVFSIIVKTSNA